MYDELVCSVPVLPAEIYRRAPTLSSFCCERDVEWSLELLFEYTKLNTNGINF